MKMTAFLLLAFCLHISAHVNSQSITLNVKEASPESVFSEIKKQTGYSFIYTDKVLKESRKISIQLTNAPLNLALESCFADQPFTYKIIDKTIILQLREPFRKIDIPVSSGQTKPPAEIKGIVVSDQGEPVENASVLIVGTTTGTTTKPDGSFVLNVTDDNGLVLEVSSIGFKTKRIAVGKSLNLQIVLERDISGLSDIVVVGYGTQKKINLTGAVESVGSEVFENRSMSNTTQALQGAIPNLNLSFEDGKPTRSAAFNVRGMTSIGQGGSALVLIDGVEGNPLFLNPNDIESVSVLKDAASAAIYGARGSFGVVLITTKQPKRGRTMVNYTGNTSIQSLAKRPAFVTNGLTWLEHFRTAFYNQSGTVPTSINNNMQYYSDDWLERMRSWEASGADPKTEILPNGNYEYYANTDWMGLLFKKHTMTQDHNLTISGGSDKSDFYISGRLYDFGGIYNFDPDKYRSYNLRGKASLKAFDWLKITNNMEFSSNSYHMPYTASGRSAGIQRYIEVSAFPTMPMYNPDGTNTRGNAYTLGAFVGKQNFQNNDLNLFRNTIGFKSNFFDNTFRVIGDYTFRYDTRDFFFKRVKIPYYQNANAGAPSYLGDLNGSIYEWMSHTMYTASNLYGEYENTFAQKHDFKAMAGWNYETSAYKANSIERNQLLLESAESIQLATGSSITPGATVTKWKTAGMFFRMNYSFDDRYLLEINGRYDGSSRFPVDQQWGFFPSISAGWRLSRESFWKVSDRLFSDVKFRASYGSLGNGNISPYQFLELLSISNSTLVLDGNLNKSTSVPAPIPTGLTWERATTTDFGIDFKMVQNKLGFTGDYYVRKTTGMYVPGPTLPDIFGAASPKGNYADMTTKGFEISLTWNDQFQLASKAFSYNLRATLYDYVSTIDKYHNPTKRFTDYYDGMTIGELWGFRTDGLFQEDPDPTKYINTNFVSSADAVWRAGDLKIQNLDGSSDNMITKGKQTVDDPGDMTIIGNTQPRYQYSFTLGAEWNGFFASAFFFGVGKQDWYPGIESAFWGQYNRGYNQMPAWHLGNYWTPDNRDAYLPRYSQYNGALGFTNYVPNDRYLQKVSYLRLKNIQVGYNLPQQLISRIKMRDARIYLSGENLTSWSPLYKVTKNFMDVSAAIGNTDSDLNSSYNQGAGNSYPLLKTISLGLSLTF